MLTLKPNEQLTVGVVALDKYGKPWRLLATRGRDALFEVLKDGVPFKYVVTAGIKQNGTELSWDNGHYHMVFSAESPANALRDAVNYLCRT